MLFDLVVVPLSGTKERSSTSVLAAVMTASVVSGVISDTDPTNVVLPTPNPPATTILTEVMALSDTSPRVPLELAKSTENPFKQVEIRASMCVINLVDPDKPVDRHVSDQHTRHA